MKSLTSVSGVLLLFMQLSMCMVNAKHAGSTQCIERSEYYTGSKEFKDIFKGTPTKPPEISNNQGVKLVENAVSITIGEIPEVGSVLKGFFDVFTSVFDDSDTDIYSALNTLYQDLETEVKNLKLYVDKQIAELKTEDVKDHLGALEIYAHQCTLETDPPDILKCTEQAYRMITSSMVYMMPTISNSKVLSETELRNQGVVLQRVLPMLRHYGDLLIAVTLEAITGQYHMEKRTEAQNYIRDFTTELNNLISYVNKALPLIELYSIAVYDFTECVACVAYTTFPQRAYYIYHQNLHKVRISSTFGPGGSSNCTLDYYDNIYSGAQKDPVPTFRDQLEYYKDDTWASFRNDTLPQVRKYYDTMFGKTIDNWKSVLMKLESKWTEENDIDSDERGSDTMNNVNEFISVVYEHTRLLNLIYNVGRLGKNTVNWGDVKPLDSGRNPHPGSMTR